MNNRFKLEKSKEQPGWWVLTDTKNLVVIKFEEHKYNETQKVYLLKESEMISSPDIETKLARIMREMGEYMSTHWYSVAMPTPVYELRQDDETDRLLLIRNKHPRFTLEVEDNCTNNQLAAALRKAAEYISKRVKKNRRTKKSSLKSLMVQLKESTSGVSEILQIY